jgi:hypothetical protein
MTVPPYFSFRRRLLPYAPAYPCHKSLFLHWLSSSLFYFSLDKLGFETYYIYMLKIYILSVISLAVIILLITFATATLQRQSYDPAQLEPNYIACAGW